MAKWGKLKQHFYLISNLERTILAEISGQVRDLHKASLSDCLSGHFFLNV